jgi:hypothetical protein
MAVPNAGGDEVFQAEAEKNGFRWASRNPVLVIARL